MKPFQSVGNGTKMNVKWLTYKSACTGQRNCEHRFYRSMWARCSVSCGAYVEDHARSKTVTEETAWINCYRLKKLFHLALDEIFINYTKTKIAMSSYWLSTLFMLMYTCTRQGRCRCMQRHLPGDFVGCKSGLWSDAIKKMIRRTWHSGEPFAGSCTLK